jgi:hypothetical protein
MTTMNTRLYKKIMKRYAALFNSVVCMLAVFFILTSCDDPVTLDIDQTQPKVVIEGVVTNHAGRQYVKLSRSAGFYATGKTPRIVNGTVSVTDNQGNVYTFLHNPNNHADSAGYYLPVPAFTGVIGRTYSLNVQIDGERYTASDYLARVTTMDSLSYKIDEDEEEDTDIKVKGRIYELLLFTKEPRDEVNIYLFKFYRNDSLVYNDETDIYYSDDEFLGENIDGVESPVFYSLGDKAAVEMYSISRAGYVYFNDLSSLLNNDAGGMFGSVPAAPRTNVSNGALGFFQVSALDIMGIKLE